MGLGRWLGEFFDTNIRVERARFAELRQMHERRGDVINQLTLDLEARDLAIDTLSDRLAEAAQTISTLRDQRKRLRAELIEARSFMIDASNDVDTMLEGIGPRSKRREGLLATQAAMNADLKRIADLLVETSK